mgnify:CR=1 FL=1
MNFQEAIDRACEEPTLLDALSWIAVWENERVIPIAHSFLSGEIPRNPDGSGWTSCFKFLIKEVMEQYDQQRTLRKLKAIK